MPLKPPPQNLLEELERERDRGRGWLFWWMRAAMYLTMLEARISDLERRVSFHEDIYIVAHLSGRETAGAAAV